ncbi:dihydrosphingosine 1-phosphate phosphatase Lcb3p [[Candida] jaroonii]|uniref:Dihydrosphingosine 1-phosphate phosphatase Lcb3p n=1 Tax=[Candida] jaroonii TaxID=467808 RepID=A0ACA9YCE8_9ASCO|nr:dihydrosphingosine 1-phosphate phosphatase Lcb3p [[Candida] jaroonii]
MGVTNRKKDIKETIEDVKEVVEEKNSVTSENNNSVNEVGNEALDHYKQLPPYRFKLRNRCLPIIRKETEILASLQAKLRNPILDYYFAWTANLASHTFYVLMLPLSNWFGSASLARDLVFVLGIGIYLSGNLKDFLCLPRPRSPPLHRITMSSYTTQEYGFPSSHSANATAVTLLMADKVLQMAISYQTKVILMICFVIYYVSLIFGRLYCGMHGFFDILTGSVVGVFLYLFRKFFGEAWDNWFIFNNTFGVYTTPFVIIGFYLMLVHIHFEPIDDCPCFDDSVAFIGVLIGLDLSHWLAQVTGFFLKITTNQDINPIIIDYNYEHIGLIKSIIRVIMGISMVVVWQLVSKRIVFTILPPVYKFIGINLPRRNYKSTASSKQSNRTIRSQSISNLNEEEKVSIIKKDKIGIETDIDYYEMVNHEVVTPEIQRKAKVFKPRYDVEIIGRLIVYAGISVVTVWGFALGTHYFKLS